MFDDIIGTKSKFVFKLEKNGKMIEDAVLDTSEYIDTGRGYIICDGLQVTDEDCFMLLLTYTKDTNIIRRMVRIIVESLPGGRIKFTSAGAV